MSLNCHSLEKGNLILNHNKTYFEISNQVGDDKYCLFGQILYLEPEIGTLIMKFGTSFKTIKIQDAKKYAGIYLKLLYDK